MIPLELRQIFDREDDPIAAEVADDAFDKFLQEATLAGAIGGRSAHQHVANFRQETAQLDAGLASHYRRIAAKAEGEEKNPPPAVNDPERLEKRRLTANEVKYFQQTRDWLRKRANELGTTPQEIVDRWCVENPHHSAEVLQDLRQIAEAA
jgi:hypothetical protein